MRLCVAEEEIPGRNPELLCSAKSEADAGGGANLSAFATCPIQPHPFRQLSRGEIEAPEVVESGWRHRHFPGAQQRHAAVEADRIKMARGVPVKDKRTSRRNAVSARRIG